MKATTEPGDDRAQLAAQMQACLEELRRLRGPQVPAPERDARARLKRWQAARLAGTYADLLNSDRWGPAARFFLDDLYAPKNLHERDQDVARVVPKMERLLPRQALHTLVKALRMDALSEALDADLAQRLGQAGRLMREADLDEPAYTGAYCEAARDPVRRAQRLEQIELVDQIGHSLDQLTRLPMLATSLKLMKKPAELAGLGELHGFLLRGFSAFAHMRGADEFLERIVQGERQQMQRWLRSS